MANKMRHRWGAMNPVMIPPETTTTVIEIGQLLILSSGEVKHAGTATWTSAEIVAFAGVAMQASPTGKSDAIRVAQSGVFEYNADTTTAVATLLATVEPVGKTGQTPTLIAKSATGKAIATVEKVFTGTKKRYVRIRTKYLAGLLTELD